MIKRNIIRFDWAIKLLLRNRAGLGILEGFLAELLKDDVKIESILENEDIRESYFYKKVEVILLVKDIKGELIILEIVNEFYLDYLCKMLPVTPKIVPGNIQELLKHKIIKKAITINLAYFDLGHGDDYLYFGTSEFIGVNKNDKLILSRDEELAYLREKFKGIYNDYYIIKVEEFDGTINNAFDEWLAFIKNEQIEESTKAKGLVEAFDYLDVRKLSPDDKLGYDYFIKEWRNSYGTIVGSYYRGKYEGRIGGRKL